VRTTITERGQVSIPVELRREMKLTPGQTVLWEKVSATECRLVIEPRKVIKPNPVAAIGFAKRHGAPVRTTAGWMKILREGEDD
jgi:bifunctional DNA-binding transcriptional regulator/antitoxin component of YhaV-PrlF toxin-antitoxin module